MLEKQSNSESALTDSDLKDMSNAIRALSMDAVQQANSGHPGMPMGMADVATVLFSEFLKYSPSNPHWLDRDRFVLSAGHGSMLLYSLLYLSGYQDISLDEIKNFRQLHSKTAGHPEYGEAAGIETTTGPLGQGIATAVGMAIAEKMQAARYSKDIADHHTYVIAGDGCLMEGISHEAISLAGHLKLNKLIVLFDDNGISIDGKTELTVSDDQCARFKASGWDVQAIDGHNIDEIRTALAKAQHSDKPSMIACKTTIAYGAPTKAGTSASHGAPLGDDEIKGTREFLGWKHGAFDIPDSIRNNWLEAGARSGEIFTAWQERFNALDADKKALFERTNRGDLPENLSEVIDATKQQFVSDAPNWATRKSSSEVLAKLTEAVPELIGGSADLTGSNLTKTSELAPIHADDFSGRYMYYGVREHAMAAAMNGIALHGGFIPYGGTFLVFTDYCRPAIRLSALMKQRVIYVMTHDSIGLGEDGPTHQPVEHLAALRAMPNVYVYRPADAIETLECWQLALEKQDAPSVLVLSRQGLPSLSKYSKENNCAKGAYILAEADNEHQVTITATGSEVQLAMEAKTALEAENIGVRVISMPCMERFEEQSKEYRMSLLCDSSVKVAVEAACSFGWDRYLGMRGIFVGMQSFGASAPAKDLYQHFGITSEAIIEKTKIALEQKGE